MTKEIVLITTPTIEISLAELTKRKEYADEEGRKESELLYKEVKENYTCLDLLLVLLGEPRAKPVQRVYEQDKEGIHLLDKDNKKIIATVVKQGVGTIPTKTWGAYFKRQGKRVGVTARVDTHKYVNTHAYHIEFCMQVYDGIINGALKYLYHNPEAFMGYTEGFWTKARMDDVLRDLGYKLID